MGRVVAILLLVIAVLLLAGAVTLAFLPIPAPSGPVERVIPNERFLSR
jgi:hypothetical protein